MLAHSLLLFLAAAPSADAARIRLVWDAPTRHSGYEVQTASDRAFSKDLKAHRLAHAQPWFEASQLPAHARARTVRADGKPASAWQILSTRSWKPVELPPSVEISRKKAGKETLSWDEPEGFPLGGLAYRARIFDASGATLADQLLAGPEFRVPDLPGGTFELQVETLGDARRGALHLEGTGVAASVIVAEAKPFDPARPGEVPLGFLELRSFYQAGPLVRTELSLKANGFRRTSALTGELRYTTEGGFQVSGSLPVTWLESDEHAQSPRSAPRLGGDPWPEFNLSWRLAGDDRNYVGLGPSVAPAIDTSDNEQGRLQGTQVRAAVPLRMSVGKDIAIDSGFFVGATLPASGRVGSRDLRVLRRLSWAGTASVSYFWRDRWQFGAGLTFVRLTAMTLDLTSGPVELSPIANFYQPRISAAYRLSRTAYVDVAVDRFYSEVIDDSVLEPFLTWRAGITYLF